MLDIAFVVHVVSQFMHAPRTIHLLAVKRIYRYLQDTTDHGLSLWKATGLTIVVAYSDADWASCLDSSRSTSCYTVFFDPNLISWRSKKQPTMSKSSTEAEYRALAYTIAETLWILHILVEIGNVLRHPVTLFCDNISATYITTIMLYMIAASISRLIIILFESKLLRMIWLFVMFPHGFSLQTFLLRDYLPRGFFS
ncbi:uncharacterized protein LOC109839995 [Asparagus officinalis]|uniref:uncharacterized protein LOC109839995 n=1 Tax=Asparagus officinalis TaxID=4686 RepID=UPI00098E1939|nr:uncharacterized protein LOC109839995 [Asparagus officinalis]